MKINNKEYNVDELVAKEHFSFLNRTKGGLLLNDYEKKILKRYDINYDQYTKLSDLVFDIETIINESYDYEIDDLIDVSSLLAERCYYEEVHK